MVRLIVNFGAKLTIFLKTQVRNKYGKISRQKTSCKYLQSVIVVERRIVYPHKGNKRTSSMAFESQIWIPGKDKNYQNKLTS